MHTLQVRLYDKALYDMPKASQFFIASRLLRHSASVYQRLVKATVEEEVTGYVLQKRQLAG